MPGCGCDIKFDGLSKSYKTVLWIVIAINASMFVVEMTAGAVSESMALRADALDFLGDSLTYAVTLYVIGRPIRWRAFAALFKGISLAAMGLWVLGSTIHHVFILGTPDDTVMGVVGMMAFAANVCSALLLMRYRNGDANVRSVWLCSRNDAIGNLAVVLAAGGVFATGTGWPDLFVALAMAALFLQSSFRIIEQACGELRASKATADSPIPVLERSMAKVSGLSLSRSQGDDRTVEKLELVPVKESYFDGSKY